MAINFLEVLVCPICKGHLLYKQDKQELICQIDKLVFPIEDGIPMMLVEKARKLTDMDEEETPL